jgi:hypothetical protein
MTMTTLQLQVERGRFARHAKAVLAAILAPLVPMLRMTQDTPMPAIASVNAADKRALEAQQVRDMAGQYAKTQPGFASDLYAAADRHERQTEG